MIKIGYKTYNELAKALIEHREREAKLGFSFRFPFVFLLATHRHGEVIDTICKLNTNTEDIWGKDIDHCHRMDRISARQMVRGALKLMKVGCVVRGLARVGDFERPTYHHQDGDVERELYEMHPDMFFMTIQPSSIGIRCGLKSVEFGITKEK